MRSTEYSYETYILLWVVCTEGSQSTVTKGTEFSGNRHIIPCTFVPNSAPIGTELRYKAQERLSRCTQDEANHVTRLPLNDDVLHIQQWANTIIDPDTGASMEYRHLIKHPKYYQIWAHSFANELG
jgi:hypothetical protein